MENMDFRTRMDSYANVFGSWPPLDPAQNTEAEWKKVLQDVSDALAGVPADLRDCYEYLNDFWQDKVVNDSIQELQNEAARNVPEELNQMIDGAVSFCIATVRYGGIPAGLELGAGADAVSISDVMPNAVTGGLSNTLRYKWFDLSFMFSYQFGAYGYDNWAQKTEHGGKDFTLNIPAYYRDNWKQPGDISKYEVFIEKPAVAMNGVTTTRRLHSTDFIRLKTLTFGVTVPKTWTRKIGVNSLRLYASANNLWTWAAYDFYDPESVSAGTAGWGTPPLKTVTFGLNLNF